MFNPVQSCSILFNHIQPRSNPYFEMNSYYRTHFEMNSFAGLCSHSRLKRLDQNFVKCVDCGESQIKPVEPTRDELMQKYMDENRFFDDNFIRNFDNKYVPQKEWEKSHGLHHKETTSKSLSYMGGYHTYSARDGRMEILVESTMQESSDPKVEPQHAVRVDGRWFSMSSRELKNFLVKNGAHRC
jgi:hypothetical protein